MKSKIGLAILLVLLAHGDISDASLAEDEASSTVVFRPSFSLKLHIDKENYYEQEFSEIPYVHDNWIYLFAGEEFGVSVIFKDDVTADLRYEKEIAKADVVFRFEQRIKDDGTQMMMLKISNNLKRELHMDALMTVPEKEKPYKTTILPVGAGLSNYESWPHPIVQLALSQLRLTK